MRRVLLWIFVLWAWGCSEEANNATNNTNTNNSTTNTMSGSLLWAKDFDQSCEYDGDCELVFEGDQCLCGGNGCPNTAVAKTAVEAWTAASLLACPEEDRICSRAACLEMLPACQSGKCAAREPVRIDASDWDKNCALDSDCAIIHEGEVCSACVCGGTSVNVSELAQYEMLRQSVDCTPGPDFCECATIDVAWCNAGVCEPGVNPKCVGVDNDGFFANCDVCGGDCDTIDAPGGERKACGCSSSADCPCGLSCGDFEIAPNIVVSGVCVR